MRVILLVLGFIPVRFSFFPSFPSLFSLLYYAAPSILIECHRFVVLLRCLVPCNKIPTVHVKFNGTNSFPIDPNVFNLGSVPPLSTHSWARTLLLNSVWFLLL